MSTASHQPAFPTIKMQLTNPLPLPAGRADYFGSVPNLAARLMAVARPGQMLLDGGRLNSMRDLQWREDGGALLLTRVMGPIEFTQLGYLQVKVSWGWVGRGEVRWGVFRGVGRRSWGQVRREGTWEHASPVGKRMAGSIQAEAEAGRAAGASPDLQGWRCACSAVHLSLYLPCPVI